MYRQAARAVVPLLRYNARRTLPAPRAACLVRTHATVSESGPAVTATNSECRQRTHGEHVLTRQAGAEATLKRFWKNVDIEKRDGGYAVTLDRRPLKTPSGKRLIIPPEKRLVAALIASEWENQQTVLKPHALPMVRLIIPILLPGANPATPCQTSLASRALDAFEDEPTRAQVRAQLLKYFETDTIWYVTRLLHHHPGCHAVTEQLSCRRPRCSRQAPRTTLEPYTRMGAVNVPRRHRGLQLFPCSNTVLRYRTEV